MTNYSSASDRKDTNLQTLARGVLVNIGGKAIGRGGYILNQVILARILGPEKYGLYGIGWIFFRIASLLSTLGLDSGVIHQTSEFWEKDKKKFSEVVMSAFLSSFAIGIIIGLFIYLFSLGLSDVFKKPALETVLRLFSFSVPAMAGLTILSAATRVTKDMRKSNLIEEIVLPCLLTLMIVIVYLIEGGLNGFVLGSTLAIYLSLGFGILITSSDLLTFDIGWKNVFGHLKGLFRYSLPITVPILFGTLINLADRIITGYFLPEYDTGIYQSVSLISALFVAILSAFKTMAAPMLAENYHFKEKHELANVMKASTRWVFMLCAPIFIVLFLAPIDFIRIVFGDSYLGGTQALIMLACAQLINIAKGPVDQLLIMTGNQRKWLVITFAALTFNVIANVFFIPIYGIVGAALSQILAYSILAIGGILITRKELNIIFYDRRWLINLLLAGFTALILYGVRIVLDMGVISSMIITCLGAGIIYLLLLLSFGMIKAEKEAIMTYAKIKPE